MIIILGRYNYSNMSDSNKLEVTRNFKNVGTVSYPQKFGDIKFPITYSEFIIKNKEGKKSDFSKLCVSSSQENIIGSMRDYKHWCLYNGITKSLEPNI